MKDYLIAWAVTIVLTVIGLFGCGFVVGIIMGLTGNAQGIDNLESASWFNILVFITMVITNFLAFQFAVKKFVVDKY
jgi:hypothetical protein